MPITIAPQSERIDMVDALRGFALMGLFIVHAVEYFELYWYRMEPHWVHDVVFFLFSGKMAATFALLFGVSFHTILLSYQQRGIHFRARLLWRFVLLAIAGYLHGLLYAGDILLHLALNGFLLVLVCRLPSWAIMVLAIFCLLQVPTLWDFYRSFNDPTASSRTPEFWVFAARNFDVFAHAHLGELVRYNAGLAYEGKYVFNFETGKFWLLSGFVLLGYWLGRVAFFIRASQGRFDFVVPFIMATACALLLYWGKAEYAQHMQSGMTRWYFNELVGSYFNAAMLAAGLLLLMWLYVKTPALYLLKPLSVCGRMSLTLYISQSLICVPLFYGFGLGWYENIGQLNALFLGLVLCVVQIVFAHAWFKSFYYGPFEWLWRSLTLTRTDIAFLRK